MKWRVLLRFMNFADTVLTSLYQVGNGPRSSWQTLMISFSWTSQPTIGYAEHIGGSNAIAEL